MAVAAHEPQVVARLSTLDRFLPLWIGGAMAAGIGLGSLVPGLEHHLAALQIGTVSVPIAIGLLVMMYPVLARVRYEELGALRGEWRLFAASLVLNWLVGPALMFALAWLLLADQPAYRTGLIVVGLARCIAMVVIWNDLACGDREATAVLVVLNSLFQLAAYSLLGWFYLSVLPGWLGLATHGFHVSIWEIARTVLIFLGIPLAAGLITRRVGLRARGPRLVRAGADAQDRPVRVVRAAVHDRPFVRDPGQADHPCTAGRGADRAAAARLLRRHVRTLVPRRLATRPLLSTYRSALLYRRLEQLRARESPSPSASSVPPSAKRSPASSDP